MPARPSPGHPVYTAMATTVFEHMSGLARELGAINLGQGFPDDNGPAELREAAARALAERSNQYPPMAGIAELRAAVADFYARTQSLELTPAEVIVTSGATEALAAAILALVSPGDEVLIFAPAYDAYVPLVRRAGGVPVFVRLDPPEWRYRREVIAAAITQRTRVMIVNDPLNPTGSVASAGDLAMLAELCTAHDLIAICDEVWENVRFDGQQHRSLLSFSGMAERAIKIGSAGKIFGLTGWKVGWLCAAPQLATLLGRAHQFLTFTTPPALQWAVAEGLAHGDIMAAQQAQWSQGRDALHTALAEAGLIALPSAATWFSCIDLTASGIVLGDFEFSERAVREAGVASIPLSPFYESDAPSHLVRLCHCKPEAMLREAVGRLAKWRDALA
jgi:aspartate/methionine/tyrosine aminotransferase